MPKRDTQKQPSVTAPPEELMPLLERDAGCGVMLEPEGGTDPDEERPWLTEGAVGHTALEKLCIAIIRAHPNQDRDSPTTDLQRLRTAVRALLGAGPPPAYNALDDRQLLLSMADDFLRTPSLASGKVTAADLAADPVACGRLAAAALTRFGLPNGAAPRRRLAEKFGRDWRTLVGAVQNASYVAHGVEAKHMQIIAESLWQMGVAADLPEGAGAFWPLASEE